MSKRILAILGSPHPFGHCAILLQALLDEASKQGYTIEYVHLYEKNIGYCKGCRVCDKSDVCVIQDDLLHLASVMKESDIVILAAPTYWGNVPGIVKNMFDRLVGAAMKKTTTFPKPKYSNNQQYILVTSCDTPFPFSWLFGQSRGCIHAMKEFFKTSGMKYGGKFVWASPKDKHVSSHMMKKIQHFWNT